MNDADLDHVYTELARSLARVGESKTSLLLATLALDLLSAMPDAGAAVARISRAERLAHV